MNQVITIDPSVAVTANISPVGKDEELPIILIAEDDQGWQDEFEFRVFTTPEKITPAIVVANAVAIDGDTLTITIAPIAQNLPLGNNYYELFNVTKKRIEFKGDLKIIK